VRGVTPVPAYLLDDGRDDDGEGVGRRMSPRDAFEPDEAGLPDQFAAWPRDAQGRPLRGAVGADGEPVPGTSGPMPTGSYRVRRRRSRDGRPIVIDQTPTGADGTVLDPPDLPPAP
jgi:hypothetical protein